jgi:hypothetical protein
MEKRIYRTRIRGGFMNMRLTPSNSAHGAWLIAGRSAAGAVLLAITVSACTGGGSSVPSIFTPTPQTSGQSSSGTHAGTRAPSPTGAGGAASSHAAGSSGSSASAHAAASARASASSRASASAHASGSPHASASVTPRHTQAATPAPTRHTSAPATPAYPTAAPETGGGGTAGLQDSVLLGAGGAAVLAGLGALAFRRRLSRKFRTEPTPQDPATREPADR